MVIKKIFPFLFIQFFIVGLGWSLVGPLIPILAGDFKVSLNIIGSALALNAFGLLLASLFSGILSERFGKKNIFILGSFFLLISFLGIYFSNHFIYFILSFIIFGLSWGILMVTSTSIISDAYKLNRSKAIIRLGLGQSLGAFIAPILVSGTEKKEFNYIFL